MGYRLFLPFRVFALSPFRDGFWWGFNAWNRLVEVARDNGQGGTETVGQYQYTGDNRRAVKKAGLGTFEENR